MNPTTRVATISYTGDQPSGNISAVFRFTAADPLAATGFNDATFTVNWVNDAPVVTDIPDQTITEPASFATISLDNFVSDADHADNQIAWTAVRQSGSTDISVSMNPTSRVATISYTGDQPSGNISAVFRFTAADPLAATGFNDATFTVNWVNDTPVVSDIPDQTITEPASFATISLDNFVADADHADNQIAWTAVYQSGSAGISVSVNPTTRVATISYTGDQPSGNISAVFRFTAADPLAATSFNDATFTVNWVNDAPVVTDIPDQTIAEGSTFTTITLDNFVSDADNTDAQMTWTFSGNTQLAVSIVNRIATITTPNADWNGAETITFTATDPGLLNSSNPATFTVTAVNDRPVLAAIGPRSVTEGANLNFGVSGSDPDGDTPTIVAENVPLNATFTDNGNGTGTFNFNPTFVQAGTYNVRFIVSDGTLADSEIVAITVNEAGNQRPVLATIGPRSVTEGQNLTFNISAIDPDGTLPTFSGANIPLNASLVNNGNGTATFTFSPSFVQSTSYLVTFVATDGLLADSEVVTITVIDAGNQRPVLAPIGPKSTSEGTLLSFVISASDADQTSPAFIAFGLPANSSLSDQGNGTAIFSFTPNYNQAAIYSVIFVAFDGALADSETVVITVTNTNRAPVLASIGPKTVAEGGSLNFATSATDPDGPTPVLTALNAPLNATYVDNGNGTGAFAFNPNFTQAGVFSVIFVASDGNLADSEVVVITVTGTNLAPLLATIGPRSVTEGANLNFNTAATDPDGSTPTLTAVNVPLNATYQDNGNGTANVQFQPDLCSGRCFQRHLHCFRWTARRYRNRSDHGQRSRQSAAGTGGNWPQERQ